MVRGIVIAIVRSACVMARFAAPVVAATSFVRDRVCGSCARRLCLAVGVDVGVGVGVGVGLQRERAAALSASKARNTEQIWSPHGSSVCDSWRLQRERAVALRGRSFAGR